MQNIRRGTAAADARANGALIDSRDGNAIATAEPRRKRRREIGRRLEAKGPVDRDPVCPFIAGGSYLFRNRSLCTIAWTRLRTPKSPDFAASRIRSISSRSEKRTGAPVAKT